MTKIYEKDECAPDALDGVQWLKKNGLINDRDDLYRLYLITDDESHKFYFSSNQYYQVSNHLGIFESVYSLSKEEVFEFVKGNL